MTNLDTKKMASTRCTPIKSRIAFYPLLAIFLLLPSQSFAQAPLNNESKAKNIITPIENQALLTPEITVDNVDVYINKPTNTRWENLTPSENFYDSPYQISLFSQQSGEDGDRLWSQTTSIFAYGFGVIGVIALLPADISNWDKEAGIFGKWSDNVKKGPIWDRDTGPINLLGHPYFGGLYYQAARKSGYRQWDAFIYSTLMSTFYWEYGIEAFAEVPSIQDLVITPVLGWAYGEWSFNTEMDIRKDGGTVWGSSFLGSTALVLLDPVDSMSVGINNLFGKEIIRAGTGYVSFDEIPYGDAGKTDNQISLNVSLQLGDGGTYSSNKIKTATRVADPVDYGIIALSYGVGHVALDELWQVEGGSTTEVSLGLHLSRQFSSRLTYSKAILKSSSTVDDVYYENYSVDSQYYFNHENRFRPYLTAGFGETLWQKEVTTKRFQVNGGVGIHYQMTNNISMQADWRLYHSTRVDTFDHNATLRVIYQLGKGQR